MDYKPEPHWSECVKGPLKIEVCKGLDALGLRPSAHQVTLLCCYLEELAQWNKVYNLTAIQDMDEMIVQHLFDCLAIIDPLRTYFKDVESVNVLDVGSGAGLPAVIIAILQEQWRVTAIDAVNKKTAFIQQAALKLKIKNLLATHARVENLAKKPERYDLITSRAFSSLPDFINLTQQLLSPSGVWCAMKGKIPQDEIVSLGDMVDVFHVEQLQVPGMQAQRCLVWMRPK